MGGVVSYLKGREKKNPNNVGFPNSYFISTSIETGLYKQMLKLQIKDSVEEPEHLLILRVTEYLNSNQGTFNPQEPWPLNPIQGGYQQ